MSRATPSVDGPVFVAGSSSSESGSPTHRGTQASPLSPLSAGLLESGPPRAPAPDAGGGVCVVAPAPDAALARPRALPFSQLAHEVADRHVSDDEEDDAGSPAAGTPDADETGAAAGGAGGAGGAGRGRSLGSAYHARKSDDGVGLGIGGAAGALGAADGGAAGGGMGGNGSGLASPAGAAGSRT